MYLNVLDKHYRLNLDNISDFCLKTNGEPVKEKEITEAYERDNDGTFNLTSKINRESEATGNTQEGIMVYDFVRSLIEKLFTLKTDEVGFAVVFNTLLSYGMIEEIKE
jgi:hypothetical protein